MWAAVEQTLPQKQPKHCGNSWTVTYMCVSHYTQTGRDHYRHTRTQLCLAAAQGQLSTTQTARKLSVTFPFLEMILDKETTYPKWHIYRVMWRLTNMSQRVESEKLFQSEHKINPHLIQQHSLQRIDYNI
jgi:hypothetical protein